MIAILRSSARHDDPMEEFNLQELAMLGVSFSPGPISHPYSFQREGIIAVSVRCTCGLMLTVAVEHARPTLPFSCTRMA
ncbi:hypothetical protein ABIB10_005669 [Bradyrhizobium sp. RT3b]